MGENNLLFSATFWSYDDVDCKDWMLDVGLCDHQIMAELSSRRFSLPKNIGWLVCWTGTPTKFQISHLCWQVGGILSFVTIFWPLVMLMRHVSRSILGFHLYISSGEECPGGESLLGPLIINTVCLLNILYLYRLITYLLMYRSVVSILICIIGINV